MNTMTKFETLTGNVRYFANSALGSLYGEKYGITTLAKGKPESMADALVWRAEHLMLHSHRYQWAIWAMNELQNLSHEAYINVMSDPDSDNPEEMKEQFNAELENIADKIQCEIATAAMQAIFRGVDGTSNPLRIIEEKMKVDAAKSALESICGINSYNALGSVQVADILDGNARREDERREAQLKVPVRITFRKWNIDKTYALVSFNSEGDSLDTKRTSLTRKGDAKAAAQGWAAQLSNEVSRHVRVEEG